jgi:hypothetical protein
MQNISKVITATHSEGVEMDLPEVIGRLGAAVYILACEDNPLQQRLDRAIGEINPITETDVHPDFRADFKRLLANIDAYWESGNQPDLGVGIAQTMVQLLWGYASFSGIWPTASSD